jgi:hypothetical protein
MTVLELISSWTEEERTSHADLIAECLEREKVLNALRETIRVSEENLKRSLDQLLSGLNCLAEAMNESKNQVQSLYLGLARPKGTA